jgi:uncharacterized coiled-coil protein SlyX
VTEQPQDGGFRPVPDPTVLTTEALLRAVAGERDYVDGRIAVLEERLDAIDRATRLLNETVNRVPTDVQKEVGHLSGLFDEKFHSVDKQFLERDTRAERESRDNKVAVDAAFAAQKEAAAKQDESNAKAIEKSERATTETISKLDGLFKTRTDAQADKIDDLKDRLTSVEQQRIGRTETHSNQNAIIGFALTGGGLVLAVIVFLAAHFH